MPLLWGTLGNVYQMIRQDDQQAGWEISEEPVVEPEGTRDWSDPIVANCALLAEAENYWNWN